MAGSASIATIMIPPRIIPPTLPRYPVFEFSVILEVLPYLAVACVAALLGWLTALAILKKFGGRLQPLNIILSCVFSVLCAIRFGFGIEILQGIIFSLLLLFAANSDIRTREVSDSISIMIAITALIGVELATVPSMLLASLLITLPQLAIAMLKPGTYGGADIKIMAACAFLLGFSKGLFALVCGLFLAVICTVIARKIRKQDVKESFALIPYLAIGCIIAFYI